MSAYQEIKHLHTTIAALSKTATHLEEEKNLAKSRYEEAKSRYEQLHVRCQDVRQTLDTLQKELELCAHGSTNCTTPAAIDLSGCNLLIERLERIAIANGGELNIPAAREIIFAAGASNAKGHHLGSNILKVLKRNAQDWEWIEDRTYRYKPFADKGDAGP